MREDEVYALFGALLEKVGLIADGLSEEVVAALRVGDYEGARHIIERASRIAKFREKVQALQKEWESLCGKEESSVQPIKRTNRGHLPRGLRTPERAFQRPILEALVELGGEAPIGEVLKLVAKKMELQLNRYDREPLPSNPKIVRWHNTAQWCRMVLVQEGLMRRDTPHRIWAISEEGREALQNGRI
jgi:restriction system protein